MSAGGAGGSDQGAGQLEHRLAALLEERYGLSVGSIAPAPRGWTGETFYLTAADGARRFVKLLPHSRRPPTAVGALPLLVELRSRGLGWVSRPLASRRGSLHEWLDDDVVVVFEHLEGRSPGFRFGGEAVGDLLGELHEQEHGLATMITRETFAPSYGDELWRLIERARNDDGDEAARREIRRYLLAEERALRERWQTFDGVARQCLASRLELVPTHGDWPFNLLETTDGRLHIVDWDELILAPPERDTWFADDDVAFWRGYRARRPGHRSSETASAYYVYNRYFEEILGNLRAIAASRPGFADEAAAMLENDWMAGLLRRAQRHR